MTEAPQTTYCYSIDGDDRVVAVSDAWLEFARQNDAPELTRDRVLGRPCWQFITGRETLEIYEALFGRVRQTGTTLSVPIRCDSPTELRFMRLRVTPAEDGRLDLESVVERIAKRPRLSILDRLASRADYTLRRLQLLPAHLRLRRVARARRRDCPARLARDGASAAAQRGRVRGLCAHVPHDGRVGVAGNARRVIAGAAAASPPTLDPARPRLRPRRARSRGSVRASARPRPRSCRGASRSRRPGRDRAGPR